MTALETYKIYPMEEMQSMEETKTRQDAELNGRSSLRSISREISRLVSTKTGRCNPGYTSTAGKRLQMTKMIILPFIPVLLLITLTSLYTKTTLDSRRHLLNVKDQVELSLKLDVIIEAIQEERALAALVLTHGHGSSHKQEYIDIVAKTDNKTADLNVFTGIEYSVELEPFTPRNKVQLKNYLELIRDKVLTVAVPNHEEIIKSYISLSGYFTDAMTHTITGLEHKTLWHAVVAYNMLVRGREMFGRSSAFGSVYFGEGGLTPTYFLEFSQKYALAKEYILAAQRMNTYVVNIFNELHTKEEELIATIDDHVEQIYSQNITVHDDIKEHTWYNITNRYLILLDELLIDTAEHISERLDYYVHREERKAAIEVAIFVVVCAVSPVIVAAAWRVASQLHNFALRMISLSKQLKLEKMRSEELLYQMLPKEVAVQLKVYFFSCCVLRLYHVCRLCTL